jgi:acetyltransferase-like isoleucine patch superfamily enzyme
MKSIIKRAAWGLFLALALPLAFLSLFGRIRAGYLAAAQFCALIPGLPGDYLRICYYHLTLQSCALDSRISFGIFFAHPETVVGSGVYIGSYSILGRTEIGDRCQIASGVQILSGSRQHGRDSEGRLQGAETGHFTTVRIGSDCWIGAAAVVMADIGKSSTIGAGSVVTRPVAARSVAVGSPARVIRSEGMLTS